MSRLLVTLFFWGALAHAGQAFIYVSDGKPCDAFSDPEVTVFRLTSNETIGRLKEFFRSKKQPSLISAAIVNAGIKFCGDAERHTIFSAMLDQLAEPTPSKATWEVLRHYHRLATFKSEFNRRRLKGNLAKHESANLARVAAWYSQGL